MNEDKKATHRRALSIFLIVQVVFWLVCAVFNLLTSDVAPIRKIFISTVMIINAGLFFMLLLFIGKNKPKVFFMTLGIMIASVAFLASGGITGWEYVILAFIMVSMGVLIWSNVKRLCLFIKEKVEALINSNDRFISDWARAAHLV